jgi:hypothetical protein
MHESLFNILALVTLLLLVAVIAGGLLVRRTVEATIQSFFWERKVLLERNVWKPESSYSGYPAGSRNHRSTIEVHQTYQVTGYRTMTTMINGRPVTSTQPVYGFVPHPRKKFLYEIQRWVKGRELVASGKYRQPRWPDYTLADSDERVGEKQETYQVVFQATKGKRRVYQVTFPEEKQWAALDDKATYLLQVSLFGKVLHVQRAEN